MHYTIERTRKDEPFGDILESYRRAGNEAGKAQAFAVARQLTRKHPDSTAFVNEVTGRDDERIIAVSNANSQVKEQLPEIEYLDKKKHAKLFTAFAASVKEEMKSGIPEDEARESVIRILQEA
jgi:hypothetical protein